MLLNLLPLLFKANKAQLTLLKTSNDGEAEEQDNGEPGIGKSSGSAKEGSEDASDEEDSDEERKKRKRLKKKLKKEKKKSKRNKAKKKKRSKTSSSESDGETDDFETKVQEAMKKQEMEAARAEKLLSLDERKRPYNSMKGVEDSKALTEAELEAYYRKRQRTEDPMMQFMNK